MNNSDCNCHIPTGSVCDDDGCEKCRAKATQEEIEDSIDAIFDPPKSPFVEHFEIFEPPVCNTYGDLHYLQQDALHLSKNLNELRTSGFSGLHVLARPGHLAPARKALRTYADGLARELNHRFNKEAQRRPASPLIIHWPEGAEFLDIQDGTAMVRGTSVLQGDKRIAYLSSSCSSIHLSSGYYFAQQKDSSWQVTFSTPEIVNDDITYSIYYRRAYWSKDAAWDHIRRKFGLSKHNPFRKNHEAQVWGWTAPFAAVANKL